MFLTAQRVVDVNGGTGISVFQYTHDSACHALPQTQEELRHWTEARPGRVVLAAPAPVDQEAFVVTFLDVVATDATPLATVLSLLDRAAIATLSSPSSLPLSWLRFLARKPGARRSWRVMPWSRWRARGGVRRAPAVPRPS